MRKLSLVSFRWTEGSNATWKRTVAAIWNEELDSTNCLSCGLVWGIGRPADWSLSALYCRRIRGCPRRDGHGDGLGLLGFRYFCSGRSAGRLGPSRFAMAAYFAFFWFQIVAMSVVLQRRSTIDVRAPDGPSVYGRLPAVVRVGTTELVAGGGGAAAGVAELVGTASSSARLSIAWISEGMPSASNRSDWA
jgi:hypothetical protein